MPITGQFSNGDKVRVSDGTQQPPRHHKRKLEAWECRNYDGTVWSADEKEVNVYKGEPKTRTPTLVNCYYRTTSSVIIEHRE